MGVPRVRNAMPPPHLPTPIPQGAHTMPPCLPPAEETHHHPAAWTRARALEHGAQHHSSASAPANEYTTCSRWLAGLVSVQVVVLLWRDPLEIVEAIVASVSVLVVHLCLLWKPW